MKKNYLSLFVLLLGMLTLGKAQITPPDSVVVQLTGPSTSAYALPAKLVIKTFGAGAATFTGSNGKPETGSPYYSQQVESGATFFPITGSLTGFPARGGSSPQPNRTGGSSFLAIKADGQGNRKYWMNLSVGAYRNDGTTISEWEYHFRYFYDSATGTETGSIGAVPNSGTYTPTAIEFVVSLRGKNCKDFKGIVTDYYANLVTANIAKSPLEYAIVKLKNGNHILDFKGTYADGSYTFSTDTLSEEKLYNMTVEFLGAGDTNKLFLVFDSVKVCEAPPQIAVPNRILKEVLTERKSLSNLKIDAAVFDGAVSDAIPIKDYNLSAIDQEIAKWTYIDSEYKQTLETMNRTYISLYLLNQYYSKSNQVSGKLLKLFYDVGEGIFKLVSSSNNIKALVGEEVNKIDKKLLTGVSGVELLQLKKDLIILNQLQSIIVKFQKSIFNGFKEGIVNSMLAKFGNSENDQLAKVGILAVSKAVETALYGGNFAEDLMKTIAFNLGTKIMVDQYYIGGTQKFIDKISPKIAGHFYAGTFADVAPLVNAQVAESEQKNTDAILIGEAFESASGQFGAVGDFTESVAKIAALTVVGAPLAPPLLTISKFVKGFSLVSNAAALFEYTNRYYYITDELEAALAKGFSPSAGNQLRVGAEAVSARLEATSIEELQAYYDSLSKYKNNLSSYNILREVEIIDHINTIQATLETKLTERMNLYYAALSGNPADTSLLKIYNQVVGNYGDFNTHSAALDFEIIAHLLDSSNIAIENSLKLNIDTLLGINLALTKSIAKIDSILPTVKGSYQFVRVSGIVAPDTIKHDSQFEVTVKYKNYGNSATTAFDIHLEPSNDLSLDKDSIRVPALAAQEEASIKVKVTTADLDKNPNLFVSFDDVNSIGETVVLQLYTKVVTRGDGVTSIEDEKYNAGLLVDVFPNPAEAHLSVRTNRSLGNSKISIFDSQGTLQISQDFAGMSSGDTRTISIHDLKPGIYIVHLQDGSGNSIKREKIIVSNLK